MSISRSVPITNRAKAITHDRRGHERTDDGGLSLAYFLTLVPSTVMVAAAMSQSATHGTVELARTVIMCVVVLIAVWAILRLWEAIHP